MKQNTKATTSSAFPDTLAFIFLPNIFHLKDLVFIIIKRNPCPIMILLKG